MSFENESNSDYRALENFENSSMGKSDNNQIPDQPISKVDNLGL